MTKEPCDLIKAPCFWDRKALYSHEWGMWLDETEMCSDKRALWSDQRVLFLRSKSPVLWQKSPVIWWTMYVFRWNENVFWQKSPSSPIFWHLKIQDTHFVCIKCPPPKEPCDLIKAPCFWDRRALYSDEWGMCFDYRDLCSEKRALRAPVFWQKSPSSPCILTSEDPEYTRCEYQVSTSNFKPSPLHPRCFD